MNFSEKDIDLIPGKLYSLLWNPGFPIWKPDGCDFIHDNFLIKGAVVLYTGIIKTDIFKIDYYEFLYMSRLIYIVSPSGKYNILKPTTVESL